MRTGELHVRGCDIRQLSIRVQSRVQILPEQIPQRRLRTFGEDIDALIGRTDGVRLLDDQLPSAVEARRGPGEREGDQESQQTEHSAVDDAEALLRAIWISCQSPDPDAPSRFNQDEYAEKQSPGEDCAVARWRHFTQCIGSFNATESPSASAYGRIIVPSRRRVVPHE